MDGVYIDIWYNFNCTLNMLRVSPLGNIGHWIDMVCGTRFLSCAYLGISILVQINEKEYHIKNSIIKKEDYVSMLFFEISIFYALIFYKWHTLILAKYRTLIIGINTLCIESTRHNTPSTSASHHGQ
jgi:hypothetical protein